MANKFRNLSSKLFNLARSSFNRTSVRPRMSFPGRGGFSVARPKLWGALGALTGAAGLLIYALETSVDASSDCVHPPHQHWNHSGLLAALDKESVRRGYFVYKEVCASCHSLQYMAYRNLVGVCMTESEAKAEAEAITVRDGPNDEGEYFERPGKLSDHFPSPYANEEAARSANNGSYPPDLSYIVSARKGGEDYVFALLTGYCDPPAGFALRDGLYFNPYFSGGAIAMAQAVDNEVVTFEDANVAASAPQIAKDVCVFLKWTSEPESDERRLLLIKVTLMSAFLIGISYYIKRFKWSTLKSRKIFFIPELEAQAKKEAEEAAEALRKAKELECNKCENKNEKQE
ncbi:cytochrome c1-2, heme protein, mitochondrial [Drosophila subpulchrella]|uniref:cytochrome c1-2, heme protein, mitochondrial n=1 Tax=Drosophila subpulchrella TaxID=1486046 RepID=UPI0018A1AAEA|nr:cytochrome c1-2, heme protein, mitochondrial [Drosophila subpulchrella]XP_037726202.1 cytochrome c1-2, heme protein, mitochondrial [Drosophila subpulchrella]